MTTRLNILQITDLHLLLQPGARLLGVDTADSLRAVLAHAFARQTPDAVLATGDITHHGESQAYARFDAILKEFHQGPLLVLPGNHDLSTPMSGYLRDSRHLRLPGWDVIGIDSHVDGQVGAAAVELDLVRRACLDAAAVGSKVVLAVHHPLLELNCPWLDKDRIQNAVELLECLAEQPAVRAVVFGHAHQVIEQSFRHIRLLGTPATCFQFLPESRSFAIDMRRETMMPGYRWLELEEDGSVHSRVERVDDYPLQIELPPRR